MISTVALQALTDALTVPDGGFSVDVMNGRRPDYGYVVSILPEAERVLALPVTCQDVIEYVTEHYQLLRQVGHLFGGWHDPDTGLIYLDISVWVATHEQAGALGRAHSQHAYFDLDEGVSVALVPAAL